MQSTNSQFSSFLFRFSYLCCCRCCEKVLNNIFNLLISINAASNFILYCVLSDKYRKTVKLIFCGARPMRRGTYSSSRFTSGRTASSFYSRSHNSNFFNVPIYRQREPRFSVSKEEYASLQTESAKPPRFSITTVTPSRTSSVVSITQCILSNRRGFNNIFAGGSWFTRRDPNVSNRCVERW